MKSIENSILIVEDEINLGQTLSEYLNSKGYQTFWAQSAQKARQIFEKNPPVIVLMDIGLPDGNGLTLAKEFKKSHIGLVLIFLSAQNDPDFKVAGLELGASDYITKPFNLKELTLRLDRIMEGQKQISQMPEEIKLGNLTFWPRRYQVENGRGEIVDLTHKESSILKLLLDHSGIAVDRNTIIDQVWGADSFPSQRTVDNYIVKLRKWCETDREKKCEIQSVRGVGYKLVVKN